MRETIKIIEHGPVTRIVLPVSASIYDRSSISLAAKQAVTAWNNEGRAFDYFDSMNMTLLRGHTPRVVRALEAHGYSVSWEMTTPAQEKFIFGDPVGELRNLQEWGVGEMLKHYYGIISFGCRFGKSYTYAGWWCARGRPRTIIFAHTEKICSQMHEELSEWLGEPVGVVARTTGIKDNWQRLTIACDKSFFDKERQLLPDHKPYLLNTEAIIRDECHQFGELGGLIYDHCPNLIYSWGGSATPFKKQPEKDLLIEGYCGPLRAEAPAKILADHGIVAMLVCRWKRIYHRPIIWDTWNVLRDNAIVHNFERNNEIAKICHHHRDQGLRGIVFVDRVPHGQNLEALLPGSVFVSSTTMSKAQRDDSLKKFNRGELHTVVTTKVWREGVTFYADYAINAEGGRADHVNIQKAGRPLMPRTDGTAVAWYDFIDHGIDKLYDHSVDRYDCMTNEGWEQEILDG